MKKISLATLMFSLALSCRVEAAEIYVSQIEVDGLQRVERETVLSYLNVEQGSSVSQEYLNSSMKRLFETGLFADVNIDAAATGCWQLKSWRIRLSISGFSTATTKLTIRCWKAKFS